jgi:predicted PurR-regulated permease PerM
MMKKQNRIVEFLTRAFGAVSKYILGKLISCTIIVLAAGFILRYLGVEGSFWIGALMGIGNLVPIFGVWVGIIISVIIVLIQNIREPLLAVYVVGIGLLLQVIDEFIITPVVVGKAIDLKPLVIVAAVLVGGALFGFWGIVLAVPVAAIVKIAYSVFLKRRQPKVSAHETTNEEDENGGEV